ncbi:MAG: L,D-transpeptidase family protein [Vicinamibacterales bacterium]
MNTRRRPSVNGESPTARGILRGILYVFAAVLLALAGPSGLLAEEMRKEGPIVGAAFSYTVRLGDSLVRLGARFGVAPATLARLNGLRPNSIIHPDQLLLIDNRHIVPRHVALSETGRQIVINVAQRMLFFTDAAGTSAYPIGVGKRDWPTPLGSFTVIDKEEDPAWDVPPSIQEEMRRQGKPVIERMPPGPENPLGANFIRLSFRSLGIHGTIEPSSVYRYSTHGCVRMQPDDIAALYPRVDVGIPGVSVYEPVLLTAAQGRVFLEVHSDVYRQAPAPLTYVTGLITGQQLDERVDWALVGDTIRDQAGIAVDVTRSD